jgi:hypothetical protein
MSNSRTSTPPTATPARPRRTPKPTRRVDAGSQSAPQLRQKVVKPRARDRTSVKATADNINRSAAGGYRKSAASSSRKAPLPPRARARTRVGSQAPPTVAVLSSPSPAPSVTPSSFVYLVEVHLKAVRLKEELSNTLIQNSSDQPIHLMISKVRDWLAEELPPLYACRRTVVTARHASLSEKHWTHGTLDSIELLLAELTDWHSEGRKGLRLVITAIADEPAPETPVASQVVPPTPRVRSSATSRALAAMASDQETLESIGNYAGAITERWTCSQKACKYYAKGLCFWAVRDDATYHYPIISSVLAAWSEKIRDGELTAAEPSLIMLSQMAIAKASDDSAHRRSRNQQQTAGGGSVVLNVAGGSGGPALAPGTSAYAPSASSPIAPQSLLRGSSIQEMSAFFEWCIEQPSWLGEKVELNEARHLLRTHGFNVRGMADATADEWREAGLGLGLRKRLRASVKSWLSRGGYQPPIED